MSNLDATAREIEAWFFNDYCPAWVKAAVRKEGESFIFQYYRSSHCSIEGRGNHHAAKRLLGRLDRAPTAPMAKSVQRPVNSIGTVVDYRNTTSWARYLQGA